MRFDFPVPLAPTAGREYEEAFCTNRLRLCEDESHQTLPD